MRQIVRIGVIFIVFMLLVQEPSSQLGWTDFHAIWLMIPRQLGNTYLSINSPWWLMGGVKKGCENCECNRKFTVGLIRFIISWIATVIDEMLFTRTVESILR